MVVAAASKAVDASAIIHANSKITEVQLSKLQSDFTYQREVTDGMVEEIAENFDILASELILVADRGPRNGSSAVKGGLWVVNGQHRAKAAQRIGRTTLEARLIDLRKDPDPARTEAQIRLLTARRIMDRPLERFKAQLRAGDERSAKIVKILSLNNAVINTVAESETGINCVSTIEWVYNVDEGSLLSDVSKVITDAYGMFGGPYARAPFIKGVAWFVEKHAEETERIRLISQMQAIGPSGIERRARSMQAVQGQQLWMNIYRTLVEIYNDKLKPSNKLHVKYRGASVLGASKTAVGGRRKA